MQLTVSLFCISCVPLFSFCSASCRCRSSTQILCSKVFLPRPKLRKVDKAKRRCVFHISPLLWNRPSRHRHAEEIGLMLLGSQIQHSIKQRIGEICTWSSWDKSFSSCTERSIHKVLALCHKCFLYHLVPTHNHHLVTTEADAAHIPIGVSQLQATDQGTRYCIIWPFYILQKQSAMCAKRSEYPIIFTIWQPEIGVFY